MSQLSNKKLEALHKQLLNQSKQTPSVQKYPQLSKYSKPSRSKKLQKILKGSKVNKQKLNDTKEQEPQVLNAEVPEDEGHINNEENEPLNQKYEAQKLTDSIEIAPEQPQQISPQNKDTSTIPKKESINEKNTNKPIQLLQTIAIAPQTPQTSFLSTRHTKLHKDPPMHYSPQIPFPRPKYYHQTTFKYPSTESLSLLSQSATAQSNRDFVSENKFRATQSGAKTVKINISFTQRFSAPQNNEKSQSLNQYIEILRKVELIKFMANDTYGRTKNQVLEVKNKNLQNVLVDVQIDNVQIDDQQEQAIYEQMQQKYGEEYYCILVFKLLIFLEELLKKMFNMFAIKKSQSIALNSRQIKKMIQYFELPHKIQSLNSHKLEIFIHSQIQHKCGINFLDFVEIMYAICKLAQSAKSVEESFSTMTPDQKFKLFLDDYIKPTFKKINFKLYEFNIEKIKIFFEPYNPYQNPTVSLFYEMDNLLKHIFSLYETQNLKIDSQNYITLTNFTRFCKDYEIVPNVCMFQQAIKFFRAFQKGNQEIIYFSGLIMLLCCIAHIGFMGPEYDDNYKGFFKKIQKLFEIILYANSNVAESLMINNLNKFKD